MIDIVLKKDKTIRRTKHEDIYEGENKISWINVYLPETINDIDIKDYNIVLRCYINADNYIPYTLDTTKPINKIDITHEFTDKDRYIDAYLYITRADEVIGKTNTVSFRVNKAKDGSGLTPREHLDERIAELENENEGLEREVAEKDETITQQTEQITELNGEITEKDGQITELTNENTRLENLTDSQEETIKYLRDNPPQPRLYTPPDPIEPSGETRVVTAPSGYDGLGSVTFLGTDYMNADLQKWLSRESEEPFEVIFNSNIGDYLCYRQERMRKAVINCSVIGKQAFQYCSGLEEVVFSNNLTRINADAFRNCSALYKIIIPSSIIYLGETIFAASSVVILVLPNNIANLNPDCFRGMGAVTTVNIPSSIISIGDRVFYQCGSLQFVTIENGFNCNNLNLSASTLYSVETIVSWLEALADRTGKTAYTLTIGSTNINKLTAEQKAIATNKNWNLA